MALPIILQIQNASIEDSDALMEVWFAAFSDPDSRHLFPHTPGMRKWLKDAIHQDLTERPFQKYLKLVDTQSDDRHDRPRIAAYAKWDYSTLEERGPRYPPFHDDMPKELCRDFVDRGDRNRKRVMGDRKHIFLDMLATHPHYQRQGAASHLVQTGLDLAEADGLAMYVSASKKGAPLYARFGFIDCSVVGARNGFDGSTGAPRGYRAV
ncbi:acetyltransferase [Penicillium verhagenii]|nr:acetyltransferase [Penicillium verhagenii]